MNKSYFSYDPGSGEFNVFKTLDEARDDAQGIFEIYQDYASGDGWPDFIEDIVYGEIKGGATESKRMPWRDYQISIGVTEEYMNDLFDEYVEYKLEEDA